MNLEEAKRRVLILAEEKLTRKVDNSLFDIAQKEISTTAKAIKKVFNITRNKLFNQLGDNFTTEKHIEDDIIYQTDGATKAYYFEVDKTATIYIEEETEPNVWAELETINHTPTVGEGFKEYKGLITLSDTNNKCRIRFSGDFFYNLRNVAFFNYSFANVEDVPTYKPYVFYTLPNDFYKFDKVIRTYQYKQYENYTDYLFENVNTNTAQIGIPFNHEGEIQVHYTAYPTDITTATPNTYEFDIDIELQEIMLFYVVSLLKKQEDAYISEQFRNEYYIKMNNINAQNPNQGKKTITDAWGW